MFSSVRTPGFPAARGALAAVTGGNGIYCLSPASHGLEPDSQSMVMPVAKGGQWAVAGE